MEPTGPAWVPVAMFFSAVLLQQAGRSHMTAAGLSTTLFSDEQQCVTVPGGGLQTPPSDRRPGGHQSYRLPNGVALRVIRPDSV